MTIATGIDFNVQRALYWSALKDGARMEKQEFDYSPEEVGDWIGCDMKLIETLRGYFDEDMLTPPLPPDTKKKMLPKSRGTSTATSK